MRVRRPPQAGGLFFLVAIAYGTFPADAGRFEPDNRTVVQRVRGFFRINCKLAVSNADKVQELK
jgi:hypothetical protein